MQSTTNTNENKVKKNCRFYNRPVICAALQPERNCYQCVIAERDILATQQKHLQDKIRQLERENSLLKSKLCEEYLSEIEKELSAPVYDMNPKCGNHSKTRRRSK